MILFHVSSINVLHVNAQFSLLADDNRTQDVCAELARMNLQVSSGVQ